MKKFSPVIPERARVIVTLIIGSIFTNSVVYAQELPAQEDSTHIYENIESYSKRNKFTKFVYRLIFKPATSSAPKKKVKKKVYKNLIQKPYNSFEGKTIRHINIETLDPFGYSVNEVEATPGNFISNTGNKLHIKTLPVTIRNLLLVRQNQIFDSLLVKESERLVRSRGYIHDVSFFVVATSKHSDSVDIFIRASDKWSIIPDGSFSDIRTSVQLMDKNFMGLGHEFKNSYTKNYSNGNFAFSTNYSIPNLRNTFVNSTFLYNIDENRNYTRSFEVNRPFFSPYAKWAAGVYVSQHFSKENYHTADSLLVLQRIKLNTQDYWAGNATQIFKGNTENRRTTNFITALRFMRIRYIEKPDDLFNRQQFYSDENFYLASIGISTRKYLQDKYIFRFGVTEDVPIGKVISLTGGYQEKNSSGRFYLGTRISFGNYFPLGYMSSNFEFGTFFHASRAEQGAFTASVNYTTMIFQIGKWRFRQFVKPQVTFGINRFYSDSLTINDGYGLDGFNSPVLSGTSRLLLTLQTQAYTPWNFIGFRFGPYLILSLGMLADQLTGFINSNVYSQIGLGVLIKNENLVFKTFHISFAFYPVIPGKGQNILKVNSFKTNDFGLRDFEIGKPATMVFQ
ncbi:MAG: hypothetical protein R6W78_16660 [Bacteroidales bacterium]